MPYERAAGGYMAARKASKKVINFFVVGLTYGCPRAWEAKVTYTDTGRIETVAAGDNADALAYELQDMEKAVSGDGDMYLSYTKDVMDMMTEFRRSWGFTYPEEE